MFKTVLLAIITVLIFMSTWSLMMAVFDRNRERGIAPFKDIHDGEGE
jgi:ABC-type lipoprotein release transport system permease subunit